jgi:deoxyribonuclease-4
MPLFGAHMSIAGGLCNAFERAARVQAQALQIFTRNQRQWTVPSLTDEEVGTFLAGRKEWGNAPLAAHGSYLINLATPKKDVLSRSIDALCEEIDRCATLKVPLLIIHPGAHLGSGLKTGLVRVAESLNRVLEKTGGRKVKILLETTAGQGTGIGARFEELAHILERGRFGERLGVCFDTCHAFAAGYDIRTPEAYDKTFLEFDARIGLSHLNFFHLNDSKKELGSRVDRHEHIGKGKIGLQGFRLLVNDPRFRNYPMVLETPKGEDLKEDRRNLSLLRGLVNEDREGSR